MLTLFALLSLALAAEPCPGLAEGDPVPAGVVVGGRLACDGLLLATEDARAALVAEQEALVQVAQLEGRLSQVQAQLDAEQEHRRLAELRAAVAEARLDLAPTPPARPLPAWVPVVGGAALGLSACWLAPGAPQWSSP